MQSRELRVLAAICAGVCLAGSRASAAEIGNETCAAGDVACAAAGMSGAGASTGDRDIVGFPLSLVWPPSRRTAPALLLVTVAAWGMAGLAVLSKESDAERVYQEKRAQQVLAQVAQTKYEHAENTAKWDKYREREAAMRKAAAERLAKLLQEHPEAVAVETEESVFQQVIVETGFAGEDVPEAALDPKRICEVLIDEIDDCPVLQIPHIAMRLGPERFKDLTKYFDEVHQIMLERMTDKLDKTLWKTRQGFENDTDPRFTTFASGVKLAELLEIAKKVKKQFYPNRVFGLFEARVDDPKAASFLESYKASKAMIREIEKTQPMRIVQLLGFFEVQTFWYLGIASLTVFLRGGIGPLRTVMFQRVVEYATLDDWQERVPYPLFCIFVIFFLDWCVNDWLHIVSCAKATGLLKHAMRTQLFDAVMRQDAEYFELNDASAIQDRVKHDCNTVADHILWIPLDIVGILSTIGFNLFLMYMYSPSMVVRTTMIGVCVGPLVLGLNRLSDHIRRKDDRTLRAMQAQRDELLNKVKAVREFSREQQEAHELDRGERVISRSEILLEILGHFQNILIFTVLTGGEVANYWYGAADVHAKTLDASRLVQVGGLVYHITFCIRHLLGQLPRLMRIALPAERIFLLLESKSLIEPMPGDRKPAFETKDGGVELEFCDVSFAYPLMPEVTVLRHLSLRIPPGKTVAICGERAAGKTTVYALMQRMYDVEYGRGSITVNGHPISYWDVRSYRRAISILAQKGLLFKGTIKENILYGLNDAEQRARNFHLPEGDVELQRLLELSGAWDIVKQFPLKMEQRIGTGGVSLSGGTEQCLFIARGLVKRPAMLMMDEATSAMDTHTQKRAAEGIAMEQKLLGFSVVQVAHRIETLTRSDVLYFLEHGKVVEVGGAASLNGTAIDELVARKIEYTKVVDPETGEPEERLAGGFYRQLHEAYYDLDFHKMGASQLIKKVRTLEEQLERARAEKEAKLAPLSAKLAPPMLLLDRAVSNPHAGASRVASSPVPMPLDSKRSRSTSDSKPATILEDGKPETILEYLPLDRAFSG